VSTNLNRTLTLRFLIQDF